MPNALHAITAEEYQAILTEIADKNNTTKPEIFEKVVLRFITYYGEQLKISDAVAQYYAEKGCVLMLKAFWEAGKDTVAADVDSLNAWMADKVQEMLQTPPADTPSDRQQDRVKQTAAVLAKTKLPTLAEVMQRQAAASPKPKASTSQAQLDAILGRCKAKPTEENPPIDPTKMRGELKTLVERTNTMRDTLLRNVFGQDHAVNLFAEGYFRAELLGRADASRRKPKATFLFAGPPGVGKTYLAEQGAAILGLPFLRMDMSEYADSSAATEFIGSDNVYKGAKSGNVTSFVKENPQCVILFDEVEKANISIIHLFLQMLDAGILRDSNTDEEISFKDTILIFTTNAGRQLYEASETANLSGISRRTVLNALLHDVNPRTGSPYFPPAICSRFATGNVVMFNHMETNHLLSIVKKEFERQKEIIAQAYGIELHAAESVLTALLLAEGGNADARTMSSRSAAFLQRELYELFLVLCSEDVEYDLDTVERITLDVVTDGCSPEVLALFAPTEPAKILFLSQERAEYFITDSAQSKLQPCTTAEEAIAMLEQQEIAFVVIDWNSKGDARSEYLHIEDVDSPARVLFRHLRQYMPHLPVYVLEHCDYPLRYDERVSLTENGVREILTVEKGSNVLQIADIVTTMYRNQQVMKLASASQIVAFETAQSMSADGKEAHISLFDFAVRRAVDAEDVKQILSDVSRPTQRFDDVIGAEDAKAELQYFVDYLKNPVKLSRMGLRQPRGVLLYGPPGTGKTLLAKAMAGESDVTFISADGSQFLKRYVGEGPEAVKSLFAKARKYAPTILFIDEIDSFATDRDAGSELAGRAEILNALLTEMDGFRENTGKPVFVLAATNAAMEGENGRTIDGALARRFDRKIYVELPGKPERIRFLQRMNQANNPLRLSDGMIDNLAVRSTGMSLAELENIIELSYRNAVRAGSDIVNDAIFVEAFESFQNGKEKKWNADTRLRVARHEAGHALLCWHSGEMPSYLTIVARADHGGYMQHGDTEDKGIYTAEEMRGRIRTSLGGRAAELVYYGEDGNSSGASGDLQNATNCARRMLCRYGMDNDFGLAVMAGGELSGEQSLLVRQRINALLADELQRAKEIIVQEKTRYEQLVNALLERDYLTGPELEKVLGEVPKKVPVTV
ncbi:MAG: AAA family ATPase [Oscillospiraceae bacterium]